MHAPEQVLPQIASDNLLVAKTTRQRLLQHLLFWILYYAAYGYWILFLLYQIRDPVFYVQVLAFIPFDIGLVYLNFYVLIPGLLYHRKIVLYVLAVIASSLTVGVINILLKQYFASRGSQIHSVAAEWTIANVIAIAMERLYLLGLTTGIFMARGWLRNMQVMKEKEKQYLETELSFLKSQIQPHFFFNTLNNLYSLTLNKSDAAPDVVLKLSELMSYMLYESNTAYVSLDKEIDYLQNFMDLEQLRFGDRMKIEFEIDGNTELVRVPPLILILFVENSFKHGVKNNLSQITIHVHLRVTAVQLEFEILNPYSDELTQTTNAGIGLKNVKRRLDLLYGNNYELIMNKDNDNFRVALKIPLS